jgi:hypothetical protein
VDLPNTRLIHTQAVQVTQVDARIDLADQIATTTLDIALRNPTNRPLESELLVPVPQGAVLKAFTFEGGSAEGTARLLPREEARRIYDSIVAQTRDPALLEFVGQCGGEIERVSGAGQRHAEGARDLRAAS